MFIIAIAHLMRQVTQSRMKAKTSQKGYRMDTVTIDILLRIEKLLTEILDRLDKPEQEQKDDENLPRVMSII